jgi:2-methylcitrate dehydratase PrpD
MTAVVLPDSVSERLVSFLMHWSARGVPVAVLHEAKRLLLNQLKASVGATSHDAVRILHDWARAQSGDRAAGDTAQVLWFGDRAAAEHAIVVNGALFEVLDYHDTYIPTFMHATSAVLPAVLAAGEIYGKSGCEVLNALALGMEVELAVATILMPTGYYRGFVPAGLVGGVGAAAGCAVLAGLDATRMRNAIGLAMCTAFGTYESVGSMALSYITGATARSGFTAFQLAERGLDAPRTAFEGEKGMLSSYSNEPAEKIDAVLADLGTTWRIHGQTYKTVPTETITHGPIECVLALRGSANGRTIQRMRFGVEAIVVKIADERRERFGNPNSELTARFDTRFCAAAAWQRGRFTLDEMRASAYSDAAILDLRSRIDLLADPSFKTFNGAALEITYTDGSTDAIRVPAFLGTPENRMSDQQLADVFRLAAEGTLSDTRAAAVLEAVWSLEQATSLKPLMALLSIH